MKIVQTCQTKSWGGLEMQTVIISRALMLRGHDVVILCSPGSEIEKQAKNVSVETAPLFTSKINKVFTIGSFFRKFKPDVIHSHLSHDLGILVPALAISGLKTPLILTKRMGSNVKKKDFIHRLLYNRVNLIYAISGYIRQSVLDTCPVKPEKVKLLLNSLDIIKYQPNKFDKKAQKEKYGIPPDKTVIGFIGRLSWAKGIRELLEGAEILTKKHPELFFLIVGKATLYQEYMDEEIKELAKKHIPASNYFLAGFKEDVSDPLAAMDILAFPSYLESFGNVVLESMAMNVPVAGSNTGGVLDMITHKKTGILFEPKNVASLVAGLDILISDQSLRDEIRINARKHVDENFKFENYISTLESDYLKLMQ